MGYYDVDKFGELYPPGPNTTQPAQPGYNATAEYLTAALPWVTGSVVASTSVVQEHKFPYVSKRIQVRNHGTVGQGIRVGFTVNGVTGTNYVLLDGTQVLDIDVRVKAIFVLGNSATPSYSVFAGLTPIPSKYAPTLTGSQSVSGSWQGVG